MPRERVQTDTAPQAIGPYSQGIHAAGWVFTAGQLGGDPTSGELPEGIEAQARQALTNVGAILAAAGCGWADVVKTTVYLADMGDFAAFNAVYAETVQEPFPVRSTIQAARLPRDGLVEIDAIALRPGGPAGGSSESPWR
ncbi:MAG: RidA family protein [Gemmatimonadota bacterium]